MMMPYGTTTLEWVEKHAEHLLAIGASTLYLDDADGPRPWEHVVQVDFGGAIRMGLSVSLLFTANLPCGLSVSWSEDIERHSANGTSTPAFDASQIASIVAKVPDAARGGLRKWAEESLDALGKQRAEWDAAFAGIASAEAMCRRAVEACSGE